MSVDRWIDKEVVVKSESESENESCSVVSNSLQPRDSPWNSPGKNTGVDCHTLLQGIVPTQGSNSGPLHCRQILYQLSHEGSPRLLAWVAYPFSSRSSQPRNQTGASWQADSLPAELPGYYLAIKRNAFESVLMRWKNLQPVTQSEVRKRKI